MTRRYQGCVFAIAGHGMTDIQLCRTHGFLEFADSSTASKLSVDHLLALFISLQAATINKIVIHMKEEKIGKRRK